MIKERPTSKEKKQLLYLNTLIQKSFFLYPIQTHTHTLHREQRQKSERGTRVRSQTHARWTS